MYAVVMHSLVVVHSRNPGIGNGLTYDPGDLNVQPGSLVKVSFRKKLTEGIVVSMDEVVKEKTYEVLKMQESLSEEPLLSESHLKTARWMAGYYFCSLRSALTPFLPSPPWRRLIAKERASVQKTCHPEHVEGSTRFSLGMTQLNDEQKIALESIRADKRPSLLFGVTGSGKTEVYAHLIADHMKSGKQSIVLVPEILLTEHILHRFEELFDRDSIAVLHSRLTPVARAKQWKKIRSGEVFLVIGSRSALFAPCKNLGLVIIDEEHEWTYKNEQTPRYHVRETAETLCNFSNAKLVFGTATPSLESWKRVKEEHYHMARLEKRYRDQALPSVRVIDLADVCFGKQYPFSPPLLAAIEERLKRGEQSVLFLNRRGIASAMLCLKCKKRLMSPASQLPYTVHRDARGNPYLLDHFSGTRASVPVACPHCGTHELLEVGAGTQRLEEVIGTLFPKARVLRADSDMLQTPEQMRELLQKMRDREADILLGTQSVVKGLDLPEVTLAAVLIADIGLSLPHFRAGERVFQLLTQLTGRSGRAKAGEVIIQTFRPDAAEIQAAAQHRTVEYLETELRLRTSLGYPPLTEMIRFIFRSVDASTRAKELKEELLQKITENKIDAHVSASPTVFGGGKVWHVLLRGKHLRSMLPNLNLTDVIVDVDPVECL